MSRNGLLIDYQWCTGCHSCEVACRNELKLGKGQWGIKLAEIGPWKIEDDKYEWNYIPVPTSHCNLCKDRVEAGKQPSCVHHCLGKCMEYGPLEELAKKAEGKGKRVTIFAP